MFCGAVVISQSQFSILTFAAPCVNGSSDLIMQPFGCYLESLVRSYAARTSHQVSLLRSKSCQA